MESAMEESSRRGAPAPTTATAPGAAEPAQSAAAAGSVFVPSTSALERGSRRWRWLVLLLLASLAVAAVGVIVAWPRLRPRPPDAVERVADEYLQALARGDSEAARRLSTIEDAPGIRSARSLRHQKDRDRRLKGSFAPIAALHRRIAKEFVYDPEAGRFTPKNALGIAGETLDALHSAKEDAEKSGLYKKMQSGNPDDLFAAADEYGKVFSKLAEGALSPKRLLPTYKMLIDESKPPLPDDAKALAGEVAGSMPQWEALLKRPFHTLKADGPFIYERAEVTATVTDRLASLGDPPSRMRLQLVRFRLEGIDTGWKVVSAARIQPGGAKAEPAPAAPTSQPSLSSPGPTGPPRSLHDPPEGG
jgi:hypothetical protein